MYKVFKAPGFQKKIEKTLTKYELKRLDKFIDKLRKGYISDKPLTYDFLREKNIGNKRIYFLIYEGITLILLVNVSNKKIQQKTINDILDLLPKLKEYAYALNKKN